VGSILVYHIQGADLAGVANVSMKTIADYLLEAAGYAYLGVAFTLQDMFSSVFTVFPAQTGDWWQVQLYETKYTKYCGIDNMWDGTYSVKAISEKGTGTFTHKVYDYSLDIESTKVGSKLTYQLSNYNNLDYYAYLHQYPSDIPYIEEITNWRVNTYYSFSSI